MRHVPGKTYNGTDGQDTINCLGMYGDNTVIYTDFAAGNTITLKNVNMQDMSADDFIL